MNKIKRNILILIIAFVAIILCNINSSNAATSGNYEYTVKTDGTITITKYTKTEAVTTINIPSTIEGKKVTQLGVQSFIRAKADNIVIPNTVTTLDYGVFQYSTIKTITIPNSVIQMKNSLFAYATNLESANIDANIDTLPNATFSKCTNLKKVTLNKRIKNLDLQAFVYCESLTDLSFLDGVEEIGQSCFLYCTSIKKVTIPATVKRILSGGFDSSVEVDLSKTRLIEFGAGYYAEATKITKEGTLDYEKAYEVLELVNLQRKANNLEPLIMDKNLLEGAMTRAVELSVRYNHDRPTGLTCFSVHEKLSGENIAGGYSNSVSVMQGWMNSPDHRGNILASGYKSIGIGCFIVNGNCYWVQCFSRYEATQVTKPVNKQGEHAVYVGDNYIKLTTNPENVRLNLNEKTTIKIFNNGQKCNANCATWTSSDTTVVAVDKSGNIQAKKCGVVTITVKLGLDKKEIVVYVTPYSDVDKSSWYVSAVNYCYNNNIISGTSGTTFSPEMNLTRGMLVTILHRMEGAPYEPGTSKFSDVQNTKEYYYVAVKWATAKNIISGYENGNFGPNDPITREQLAVMLNKYCRYKGKYKAQVGDLSKFKDGSKVSNFAIWEMKWAVGSGVITGTGEKMLNPQGVVSRAQAAAMLHKYCINVK